MKRYFLALFSLLLPHLWACSDDDEESVLDPTDPSNGGTEVVTDTIAERDAALRELMNDNSEILVTGRAYNITPFSASVPVKINLDTQFADGSIIAFIANDYDGMEPEYANGQTRINLSLETCDENGICVVALDNLTPGQTYNYNIFYYYNDQKQAYGVTKHFTTPLPDQLESVAVELGLSVKWAQSNLGAYKQFQSGIFYPYGVTARNEADQKGVANPTTDVVGTELDPAYYELKGDWRSPTSAEIDELISKCTTKVAEFHGVKGVQFNGVGDYRYNFIFIPYAGHYNSNETLTSAGTGFILWAGDRTGAELGKAASLVMRSSTAPVRRDPTDVTWRLPIRPVCGARSSSN